MRANRGRKRRGAQPVMGGTEGSASVFQFFSVSAFQLFLLRRAEERGGERVAGNGSGKGAARAEDGVCPRAVSPSLGSVGRWFQRFSVSDFQRFPAAVFRFFSIFPPRRRLSAICRDRRAQGRGRRGRRGPSKKRGTAVLAVMSGGDGRDGRAPLLRQPARACRRRSTYLARMSNSRFTRSPGSRSPRLVFSRVWGMIQTEKLAASRAAMVRLMPLTAMEPL